MMFFEHRLFVLFAVFVIITLILFVSNRQNWLSFSFNVACYRFVLY